MSYYSNKLNELADILGVDSVELFDDRLVAGDVSYPIVDDVIILLEPGQYPKHLRDRLSLSSADQRATETEFAEDVQFTFGEEWKTFSNILPEHEQEFKDYFDLVDIDSLSNSRVCDLGCGIGRWSHFLKNRVRELVLVDFSEAIFVARKNLADCDSAVFFMADINKLPFRDNAMDMTFCLGVLHHLPVDALTMVRRLRGITSDFLVYLYYAMDNRPRFFHVLFQMVTAIRMVTSRIRSPLFRTIFSWFGVLFMYYPMILFAQVLNRISTSDNVPLDWYRGAGIQRLRQDVYDRFFTRIEQRVTRKQIYQLRDTYGDIEISDKMPYWHFMCRKDRVSEAKAAEIMVAGESRLNEIDREQTGWKQVARSIFPSSQKKFPLKSTLVGIATIGLIGYAVGSANVSELIDAISNYEFIKLLPLVGVFLLVNLFSSIRLHYLLSHFKYKIPFIESFRASIAGYLSGLIVFQLVGQVLGRGHLLKKHGVESSSVVLLTLYERVMGALVSGSLCAAGLLYIYGQNNPLSPVSDVSIQDMVITIVLALFANLLISRSSFEKNTLLQVLSFRSIARMFSIAAQTVVVQLTTLLALIIAFDGLQLEADFTHLVAASAIVSFAASLPISVNGWGVREVASMQVFGFLGANAAEAVAASIMVGLSSTFAVVILSPVLIGSLRTKAGAGLQESTTLTTLPDHIRAEKEWLDINKITIWLLSLGIAVFIFFQLHVNVGGGIINVNLADPLAILALGYFGLQIFQSTESPNWRYKWVPLFFLGISLAIGFGFLHGAWSFGVTDWALRNKLLGWIVLFGYGIAGHLVVSVAGKHGLRRLVETLVVTACVVIVTTYIWRVLFVTGLAPSIILSPNFEGYSSNRNAFAFLLFCTISAGISYIHIYDRGKFGNRWAWMIAIAMSGVWLTQSRTGLIVLLVMFIAAYVLRAAPRKPFIQVALYSISLSLFFGVFRNLGVQLRNLEILKDFLPGGDLPSLQSIYRTGTMFAESSDNERWAVLVESFDMWIANPIFGAGLGALMIDSVSIFGYPVLVHNTGMWLLAELGLVGTLIFIAFFVYLLRSFFNDTRKGFRIFAVSGVLLLGGFAIFSLTHEMLYQRPLWLILGALVSLPLALRTDRPTA